MIVHTDQGQRIACPVLSRPVCLSWPCKIPKTHTALPEPEIYRKFIVRLYALGRIGAGVLQRGCNAVRSVAHLPDIDVADLLPTSQCEAHCNRDVREKLGIENFTSRYVSWADVPMHDWLGKGTTLQKHPFLFPHQRIQDSWDDIRITHDDPLLALPMYSSCSLAT